MNPTPQFPNERDLKYYCQAFENLNPSKNKERGIAPHKPILLLSIIDLIGREFYQQNRIDTSKELTEVLKKTFKQYWQSVPSSYTQKFNDEFYYPFRYLAEEGFWHLKLKGDLKLPGLKVKSYQQLAENVEYAFLDRELFQLIQYPESRQVLIDTLISTWFSMTQQSDEQIVELNDFLQEAPREPSFSKLETTSDIINWTSRVSPVRNALFRKAIVHVYDYRCALCRLKVTKTLKQNIVEGAHIIPFSVQYNNKIDNGISFCRNHHWAFDNGLFFIDREYRITINRDIFTEESPYSQPLKDFHGNRLLLPKKTEFFPNPNALEWHYNRWSYKAS